VGCGSRAGAAGGAAAALVVIGTDAAERVLLDALSRSDDFGSTLEVRAALMEWPDPAAWAAVRQWEARHPAPPPEGHTTDIGGVVRPVFSMAEVHRNSAAGFTRYSIEKFRETYGALFERA
jgi:hypothetical protein